MKKLFLFKEDSEDRDSVKYIEKMDEKEIHSINLTGACFSMSFNLDEMDNIDVASTLFRSEFEMLNTFNKELSKIGYRFKPEDKDYNKALELFNVIKPVFDKLESKENQDLFNKVIEEEREYLQDEYNLSLSDIDFIFDNYYLDYRDRGIVSAIYKDVYDLGYEEAWSLGIVNNSNKKYFNYEEFGQDLLSNDDYLELENGRIVRLNY